LASSLRILKRMNLRGCVNKELVTLLLNMIMNRKEYNI
jgi:hypothetical protein